MPYKRVRSVPDEYARQKGSGEKTGTKNNGATTTPARLSKTRTDSVESKRWYTHMVGEHLVTIVATFAHTYTAVHTEVPVLKNE